VPLQGRGEAERDGGLVEHGHHAEVHDGRDPLPGPRRQTSLVDTGRGRGRTKRILDNPLDTSDFIYLRI
jgi:hypothetical protein